MSGVLYPADIQPQLPTVDQQTPQTGNPQIMTKGTSDQTNEAENFNELVKTYTDADVEFEQQNRYLSSFGLQRNPITGTIDEQINRLGQQYTYAGQESILALSMALNINILVTFGGDVHNPQITTRENTFSQGQPQQTIHIAWRRAGGGHYEFITEVDTSNQFSSFVPSVSDTIVRDSDENEVQLCHPEPTAAKPKEKTSKIHLQQIDNLLDEVGHQVKNPQVIKYRLSTIIKSLESLISGMKGRLLHRQRGQQQDHLMALLLPTLHSGWFIPKDNHCKCLGVMNKMCFRDQGNPDPDAE
uniref:OTU domain-containing protein n=1 Tax=Magallana gigas TaxID=29159 RepID=A0A8W8P428_MAGGI